ncbi:hypothetical protein FI667_g16385, partial [Globisporangium splendens]
MWVSTESALQYQAPGTTSTPRCLFRTSEPQRSFRVHFATSTQVRCLRDLLTPTLQWPSFLQFVHRHFPDPEFFRRNAIHERWAMKLYVELTHIYTKSTADMPPDYVPDQIQHAIPQVGVLKESKLVLFPRLHRQTIRALTTRDPASSRPHPLLQHCPSTTKADISQFRSYHKKYSKYLLPVSADLQFRLSFCILPVRSRFFFLQRSTICAERDCQAVESSHHLFLECLPSQLLWASVWGDWNQFFNGALTWTTLALPHRTTVRRRWQDHKVPVTLLWNIIRTTTLRTIWIARNRVIFEDKPAPPWNTNVKRIYTSFAAHYRFTLRQHTAEDQEELEAVMVALKSTPGIGAFVRANPDLFKIRRVQLCLSRSGSVNYHI